MFWHRHSLLSPSSWPGRVNTAAFSCIRQHHALTQVLLLRPPSSPSVLHPPTHPPTMTSDPGPLLPPIQSGRVHFSPQVPLQRPPSLSRRRTERKHNKGFPPFRFPHFHFGGRDVFKGSFPINLLGGGWGGEGGGSGWCDAKIIFFFLCKRKLRSGAKRGRAEVLAHQTETACGFAHFLKGGRRCFSLAAVFYRICLQMEPRAAVLSVCPVSLRTFISCRLAFNLNKIEVQ